MLSVYLTSGLLYYWTSAADWFTCCSVDFIWSSLAYMYHGFFVHFAVYQWKAESGTVCVCVSVYVCVCVRFVSDMFLLLISHFPLRLGTKTERLVLMVHASLQKLIQSLWLALDCVCGKHRLQLER